MLSARQVGAGANRICISRLVTFGSHGGKTEVATGSHTEECGLRRFSEQVTPPVRGLPGKPKFSFSVRL